MPRPSHGSAGAGPLLMGILNVTPDSFSDGGVHQDPAVAVSAGLRMLADGADWLDVGGESTRPGAPPVHVDEEIARVVPVIAGLRRARPDAVISVDTSKRAVAAAAIEAGADVVNDVTALSEPGMADLCAARGVSVVLMHMRGTPATMQQHTHYDDLVGEVCDELAARVQVALDAGIARDRIWLDPGVGFAKAPLDNPALIASVPKIARLGYPVVVGASRKRFVGDLTGVSRASDRVFGSIGAALAAAEAGAAVLRVHDVAATRQALTVYRACRRDA